MMFGRRRLMACEPQFSMMKVQQHSRKGVDTVGEFTRSAATPPIIGKTDL
jgi:hypothetical protein